MVTRSKSDEGQPKVAVPPSTTADSKAGGTTTGGDTKSGTTNATTNSYSNSNKLGGGGTTALLSIRYPVNSTWEFTLVPNEDVVSGNVYCTDEVSQTVVLQKPLTHTTLAHEIQMVQVASIRKEKLVSSSTENNNNINNNSNSTEEDLASFSKPLPVVQKKVLEEREKRAIRMAEESFRHINQNATPQGQAVFDKLLKACNEVVWKGKSISVLNQIQVDPPYGQDNCKIVSEKGGGQADASLERVKKIVAAGGATVL